MIKTDDQRRWWFATHPEFSSSRKKGRRNEDEDSDKESDKPSPEEVDAAVGEQLKYASGMEAELLKLWKFWFGTEMASKTTEEQEAIFRQYEEDSSEDSSKELEFDQDDGIEDDDTSKELELERDDEVAKTDRTGAEYRKGWNEGYWSIHKGKVPPDLALDEQEEWTQKLVDPIWMSLGNRHSRTLNRNLKQADGERPSDFHDGHHIVPWRHWRAGPAQDILKKYGIDIDGAVNGVWLRRDYHWTLSNSEKYMGRVNHLLRKATSKDEALQILRDIKRLLSTEKFPL